MLVVTWLLTSTPDPQRQVRWEPSLDGYQTLAASLDAFGHRLTVLADCPVAGEGNIDVVPVRQGANPYFHRWQVAAEFLSGKTGQVWCVDGTDVELLEEPDVVPGLVVGSEESTVGSSWMRATSPDHAAFIASHADEVLLNPGVVGGPAETVAGFAHHVAACEGADMTDMAAANLVARQIGYMTGPPVHTVYKTAARSGGWWRHK